MSKNTHLSKELMEIRNFNAADINFIFATWLNGLYYGNTWPKEMTENKAGFFKTYQEVVRGILSKATVKVRIACLKDDPEVILGYAVMEPHESGVILHWCFVKPVWRKLGIAKELIPQDQITAITHQTKLGKALKPKAWRYDPFLV